MDPAKLRIRATVDTGGLVPPMSIEWEECQCGCGALIDVETGRATNTLVKFLQDNPRIKLPPEFGGGAA